ncbi:MAG: glutamine--tRNA ligase/YqeY domain fusion protein [Bacteroidota bacterium]|nr:glutamine--tRNA ligase/YqeY domain fusion protein [Bacteroidota bacterium]
MAVENINTNESQESFNFIEEIVREDIKNKKNGGQIHTRFPPEPNGYLHIGHVKAILLSYGLAKKYNGIFNLRFDDTNPDAEEIEYVEAIKDDLKWLGAEWNSTELYTSDYFDKLYEWAVLLIKNGKAYVCELLPEEVSQKRGTPSVPGESPYRDRPIEESLEIFEKMKNGEMAENLVTLRAKIDLASPNMHMRDPIMYRVKHSSHHRTGNDWHIYPTYDWAHGQSDFIEGITHSLCTLEFEVHRQLYDWFLDQLPEKEIRTRQIEFARLNLNYTIMSKRKLLRLVKENYVSGWDDPRMPTVVGLRRRGFTPESLQLFVEKIGIAKRENIIDYGLLEFSIREDLNKKAQRVMGVIDPVKVIITNYPEDKTEMLEAVNNPEDESMGKREVPFSRELYIEKSDFMEDAPRKFYRLTQGREVRLRYAYFVKCTDVVKNENGEITEIHCTYDPLSKGGKSPDGRKVKATLHWVSAKDAVKSEIRLYDRLFKNESPQDVEDDGDFVDNINPESLKITNGFVEPFVKTAKVLDKFQFERLGYFCVDKDSTDSKLVFNRTVTLRDAWSRKNVNQQNQKKKK